MRGRRASTPTGGLVVAVCSVGVDLDLIPYAADARLAAEASVPDVGRTPSRLVVVTPARDRINVTRELAGLLRRPAEFVSIYRSQRGLRR